MDSYDSKERRILQRFSEVVQRHQLVVQRHQLVVQRHAYSGELLTRTLRGRASRSAARFHVWKVLRLLLATTQGLGVERAPLEGGGARYYY